MLRPVLSGEVYVINISPKYLKQVSSSDYISIRLIKEGGFPGGSVGKESPSLHETQEMQVQFLGQEEPLGGGLGNMLQHSCLENLVDRGAWQAIVHKVTKSLK